MPCLHTPVSLPKQASQQPPNADGPPPPPPPPQLQQQECVPLQGLQLLAASPPQQQPGSPLHTVQMLAAGPILPFSWLMEQQRQLWDGEGLSSKDASLAEPAGGSTSDGAPSIPPS